jgi:hypothetical protein
VSKLSNHLPARPVLNEQRVFAADLRPTRNVAYFNEQRRVIHVDWRDVAVDHAFVGVHLGGRKPHFVGVVVARDGNARKDFAHLGLVIDEPQQGSPAGTGATDAEDVFRGGIQVDNQQVVVEENNARAQGVENTAGILAKGSAAGTALLQRTVVCCT